MLSKICGVFQLQVATHLNEDFSLWPVKHMDTCTFTFAEWDMKYNNLEMKKSEMSILNLSNKISSCARISSHACNYVLNIF